MADPSTSPSSAAVEMPAPPTGGMLRAAWQLAGPHGVLLAFGIGVGEWVLGPALAITKSVRWMWVATLSILLQVVFNGVVARFTAGTGQSLVSAMVGRGSRGKATTATVLYLLAALLQFGWPVYVATLAPVLHALWTGDTVAVDDPANRWIAIGSYVFCMLLFLARFGSARIVSVLKAVNFLLVAYIVIFLFVANVLYVPLGQWVSTLWGFFSVGYVGEGDVDWGLVGAVVGYAGAGGMANVMLASLVRDEGLGVAARKGAVTVGIVGESAALDLAPARWNEQDSRQVLHWQGWSRAIWSWQVLIFGVFSFVAMFLSVNLAMGTLPAGTNMSSVSFGIQQARKLAEAVPVLWQLTLFNAFAILFSSQISAVGLLVQLGTELAATASGGRMEGARVRRIATTILAIYTVISVAILLLGISQPTLAKLAANMSGIILAAASLHLYWINTRMEGPVRTPRWALALLLVGAAVFAGLGGYGLFRVLF